MTDAPILVAPDGVDWERFDSTESTAAAREKLELSVDRDVICYTGALKRWKGVDTLVMAAAHLDKEALVYIVGGTELQRSDLDRRVGDIPPNIIFEGHVPPTRIPTVLAAADVLVLPNSAEKTISAEYTSPLKLFEYMAAGKPIVASDLPSIREILDERTAHLVPPDDPDALAEGIRSILNNPDYAIRLSERAKAEGAQYSWACRAETIMSFCLDQSSKETP
jgi:glycosyltransferase involved in cell wall biosynthesis